jgi:hypothetical protein
MAAEERAKDLSNLEEEEEKRRRKLQVVGYEYE